MITVRVITNTRAASLCASALPVTGQAQAPESSRAQRRGCGGGNRALAKGRKHGGKVLTARSGQRQPLNPGLCGSRTCSNVLDLLPKFTGHPLGLQVGAPIRPCSFVSFSVPEELRQRRPCAGPAPKAFSRYLCPAPGSAPPMRRSHGADGKGRLSHLQILLFIGVWPYAGLSVSKSLEWSDNHSTPEGFVKIRWGQCT